MTRRLCRVALFVGAVALFVDVLPASPTGDTVYVSTINLPTDFGHPVTYDNLGAPIGWDLEMGSGVPVVVGTPTVTNGIEIDIRSTAFAGIPGGLEIINPDGVTLDATLFENAGDLLETSFLIQPANQSFSSDPFGTWGFLFENVTWRQKNGSPLNLPVTLYDGSTFLEFTTTGGALVDVSFLGAVGLVSVGPHPLHPERTVIYLSDSLNDLDDVTVFPDGNNEIDAALIEENFTALVIESLLVSPITGFNIGQLYVPTVPGDANGDRLVTGADYTIWADNFGQTVDPLTNGDFNNDGQVTGADYTIWADNFGFVSGPVASVPEPSSLGLASLAALIVAAAWRSRRAN